MATDSDRNSQSKMSNPKRMLQFLVVLAAHLPVLLYAWQGQYMRPLIDDYYTLRIGRELGAWDGMVFHFNSWAGGYTNFYIKSAMSPLDILAPPFTTWLLIAMWLTAAHWLLRALLPRLGIMRSGRQLVFVVAASIVTASIFSQYSPQNFYWHAAAIAYSMPITLLTMFLALLLGSQLGTVTGRQIIRRAMAGALLCFLSAGFSEIFVALQALLLSLGMLFAPAFCRGKVRQHIMLLLGTAWLATIASILIQSNSPGVALRMDSESMSFTMTIREYLDWAARALDFWIRVIGVPRAFTGFALLFCVSFGATLLYSRPRSIESTAKVNRLSRALIWLGLLTQLLMLPLLWAYPSDEPLVFGQISPEAAMVGAANAILMLFFTFALWRWRQFSAALAQSTRLAWLYLCAYIGTALLFFGLTQRVSIHWQGDTYLYLSTLLMLLLLAAQLTVWLGDSWFWRFFLVAVLSTLIAWMLIGAIIFIAFVSVGYMQMRLLALGSGAMVLSGLVWGACLGCLLNQWLHVRKGSLNWLSRLGICSSLVALVIGVDIVSSQVQIVPRFADYAREWDDRHQAIIAQRDRGEREIIVQPLSFNMPEFLGHTQDREVLFRYALAYYGVDSITEVDA